MHATRWVWRVVLTLWVGTSSAQPPNAAEFEAAVAAAATEARALGLTLRTDARWLRAQYPSVPMLSVLTAGDCHIVFNPHAARGQSASLFPQLPGPQRAAWLGGAVRHELAHCADPQGAGGSDALATGVTSRRAREVLADLAFALHVVQQSPQGPSLVARLAELRAARRDDDPGHDTSSALNCYLAERHRARRPEGAAAGDWLSVARAWRRHCFAERPADESLLGLNSR
jgi:hypothetical protein